MLLLTLPFGVNSCQQKTSHVNTIYSEKVKDSFEICSFIRASGYGPVFDVLEGGLQPGCIDSIRNNSLYN
jgi:hypothetical protein